MNDCVHHTESAIHRHEHALQPVTEQTNDGHERINEWSVSSPLPDSPWVDALPQRGVVTGQADMAGIARFEPLDMPTQTRTRTRKAEAREVAVNILTFPPVCLAH